MLLLPAVIKLRFGISWLAAGCVQSADALFARKHPVSGSYGASPLPIHQRFQENSEISTAGTSVAGKINRVSLREKSIEVARILSGECFPIRSGP